MLVKKQKISQTLITGAIVCTSMVSTMVYASDNITAAVPAQSQVICSRDPFEKMNRKIYQFNRMLDRGIVRSIAYGYYSYTPKELQAGVHNFFENLGQPITIANDVLQFKFGYAFHDTSRFIINSTFGIGGFFDFASIIGLEPRKEDFGQTLQYWGYEKSIYLMLPVFGPSTLRDTIGFVVDSLYLDPITYIRPVALQYGLAAGRRLDVRVSLLPADKLLENIAVDEYAFIRDFYFQKRTLSFNDGQLPTSGIQAGASADAGDPFAEPGFESETASPITEKASELNVPPDPFAEPGFDIDKNNK